MATPAWRAAAFALVLGAVSALAPGAAFAFDLPALMAQLAQRKEGQATFVEQRHVAGLDAPLRSSGTMSFSAAEQKLARRTLKPRAESFVVEGSKLTLERGGRSRQVAIDSVPELAAVIAALRGALAGDAATLQRHFDARLEGAAHGWTLLLTPKDERVAQTVKLLKLGGRAGDVLSVETVLADGDRSVMTVTPQLGSAAAAGG